VLSLLGEVQNKIEKIIEITPANKSSVEIYQEVNKFSRRLGLP
jgi:hypothetical protein